MSGLIRDMPQPFQAAFAVFSAWRRLGFTPDDIWFETTEETPHTTQIFMVLRAQHKEFSVATGLVHSSREKVEELWTKFAAQISDESEEDLQQVLQRAWTDANAVLLLSSIKRRGWTFPIEQPS